MSEVKERRAKIFKNGRSRAVRIPADFDLDATEVVLRQVENGDITITTAATAEDRNRAFRRMLEEFAAEGPLGPEDEFPEIDDSDLLPLDEIDFGDIPEDDDK